MNVQSTIQVQDITREQQIRSAFKHYLSPAVVEQIVEQPTRLRLGGELRDVSALFTDVEGFAGLVERLTPKRLVNLLNIYFAAMCKVVFRHGGTIDKIVGDSLHVLFNAPLDQADHACRAVRCALELDACARDLAQRDESDSALLGRTRIGVSSGPAVVGNFGGCGRFDYTAHGDTVNVASRLEGANKYLGTRILVSGETRTACQDVCFRPVGRISLNGHAMPVAVHEPVSEQYCTQFLPHYQRAYALIVAGDSRAGDALSTLCECCPDDPLTRLHLERFEAGARSDYIELPGK